MTLRWQDVGERSHAVDADHAFGRGELFRALCGRWCEVWPGDVHRHHRWLFWAGWGWRDHARRPQCGECDRTWDAMDALDRRAAV